jgi:anti-sigma regulatory factor (Ser/Thr protein kinase)
MDCQSDIEPGPTGPDAYNNSHSCIERYARTLADARRVADEMAAATDDPITVSIGLTELILNGIEHGNLEIGSALKAQLLEDERWDLEIAERLTRSPWGERQVRIVMTSGEDDYEWIISDEGAGFDWRNRDRDVPTKTLNGRGLILAEQMTFDSLTYNDAGNVAIARKLRHSVAEPDA